VDGKDLEPMGEKKVELPKKAYLLPSFGHIERSPSSLEMILIPPEGDLVSPGKQPHLHECLVEQQDIGGVDDVVFHNS
jgi:hypothetical protein